MTRRLAAIDRVVVALVGIALVVAGLALLDWRFGWVGGDTYPDAVSTSDWDDLAATAWWPWALAAGGLVLGALGLVWLLAHAPRRGEGTISLSEASDQTGAIRIDLGSIAKAAAADLEAAGVATHVKGTAHRVRGRHVVELRGRLDPLLTDGAGLASAVDRCTQNVSDAFPDGKTVCRVLLGPDRHSRGSARTSARIVR